MSSRSPQILDGKEDGLLIVVGLSGSGKTRLLRIWADRYGYSYLNIGSLVSQRTLEYSSVERSNAVQREVLGVVERAEGDVVLCDNIELLFTPELSLDPLCLLKQAACRKVVVAAWAGSCDGSILSYAVPGHDEYHAYSRADVRDVILLSVSEAGAL
jgi:hypothetical protein